MPPLWTPLPSSDPLAALDHGHLVIWVVVPHGNPFASQEAKIVQPKPAQSKEKTSGSFGVSTTDLPAASRAANRPHADVTEPVELQHDPQFDILESRLTHTFPDLNVDFEDVSEDDLDADLRDAAKTPDYPQILLGNPLPKNDGPNIIAPEYEVPQLEGQTLTQPRFMPQMAFLGWRSDADHARAQAFALWVLQGGSILYDAQSRESDAAAAVALRSFRNLVAGKTLGEDADPELLGRLPKFALPQPPAPLRRDPATGQWARPVASPPPQPELEVVAADATWKSAVVLLRATTLEAGRTNIRHAMFILRADPDGRMRVLHITLDLAPPRQKAALALFNKAEIEESAVFLNEAALPLGIQQAAPVDGAQVSSQPDLWWDNLGGATLQVVEWQGNGSAPNLFFVPDSANRLKLQVPARFATHAGVYRWRVWSVGADGTIVLSNWRTLTVPS